MNPLKTLGRWLWRWWTGREFERKPLQVGGAVALNQDPLRYSDSAQEAPVWIFGSFSWKDKDQQILRDIVEGFGEGTTP